LTEIRQTIERFLASSAKPVLSEPGEELLEIAPDNFALDIRQGTLTLQAWNDRRNLVRRVIGVEQESRGKLVLRIERFAKRSGTLELVDLARLRAFSRVDIDADDARYHRPLRRDALRLAAALDPTGEVVLLGSVATGKYVDPLTEALGDRLRFPADFVGRGDMSRGGLLLRCVRAGRELAYVPVAGAVRRGGRPARLERLR
jgi:hypothetical protein